ncbi:MAG: hypothetical protein HKN36_02070 [Hellea sp.]|nr:hypothetical protein [Hellea sp.]
MRPDPDSILKAILAPTNTGKTHYAIERMLARESGIIGLPLRLLAREVYDKICAIKGPRLCALITGEEKIVPANAQYYVCTVEAMPKKLRGQHPFAFVAIDEVQLMAHPERGHIFTERVLTHRGRDETLFLGAETVRDLLYDLVPDIRFETRERFSTLTHTGPTKITRLPKRSVIVAFSAPEVYAIAELIRRFRGGAAVVMGGLSPRTRNSQAAMYQTGEVDFLVATDAIGMGLNLDADHVAFASLRKFDGRRRRRLYPMEVGQIAGRAGRFRNDGTFGPTGDCPTFDEQLIARLENHIYDPDRSAEWRNSVLDFGSIDALLNSLAKPSSHRRLRRIAEPIDEAVLNRFAQMPDIKPKATSEAKIRKIWEICQIPDFRNVTLEQHTRLLRAIYDQFVSNDNRISSEFVHKQTSRLDHAEGGVDILATRLAFIRTWTFCAHKSDWLEEVNYWVEKTREIEDRLSDALHEKLTAKFVDKRTQALMKGNGAYMEATIKDDGDVWVENHKIGRLTGLSFEIDESQSELEAKALRETAEKAVAPEINRRLTSIVGGTHAIFTISNDGKIVWGGAPVGRITKAGSVFNPDVELVGGELGAGNLRDLAAERMRDFLKTEANEKLAPLQSLKTLNESADASPVVKGFAYTLYENFGHLNRAVHGKLVNDLDQDARKPLRELGVTFGQYDVYMREMIRPKPASLLANLLAFGAGGDGAPFIPFAGVTSIANEGEFSAENFTDQAIGIAGYKACGPRIVRFDILNRLAAVIRQAQRESGTRRFQIMQEMLALLGCTYEEMQGVLKGLGYQSEVIEGAIDETARPELAAPVPPRFVSDDKPAKTEATTPESEADAKTKTETAEKLSDPKLEDTKPAEAAKPAKPVDRKKLSVYNFRETGEDGTITELENKEFWFLPFRGKKKPGSKFGQDRRPHSGKSFKNNRRKKQDYKGGKPPKYAKSEPRRDEDSPFAALAALKKDNPPKKGG